MEKLKVAVLEDDAFLLKELVDNLRRTELVEVLFYEKSPSLFIQKSRENCPEALLLDIHFRDETIDGVHVAESLKLPVLFISAERRSFLDKIDHLKLLGTFPVEDIGKLLDAEKLKSILKTFIPRVREYQKIQKVKIKPKGKEEIVINPNDVTFILAEAGNHRLYFSTREPIVVADKTFDYFRKNGFPEERFYKFGKSHLLNISLTQYKECELLVPYLYEAGLKKTEKLNIPSDKAKEIKKLFLK